jgi:hypothetical protein
LTGNNGLSYLIVILATQTFFLAIILSIFFDHVFLSQVVVTLLEKFVVELKQVRFPSLGCQASLEYWLAEPARLCLYITTTDPRQAHNRRRSCLTHRVWVNGQAWRQPYQEKKALTATLLLDKMVQVYQYCST